MKEQQLKEFLEFEAWENFLFDIKQFMERLAGVDSVEAEAESSFFYELRDIGRRYNHFIFLVSEILLDSYKNLKQKDRDDEILRQILVLEQYLLSKYPKEMKLFFAYRETLKKKS